MQVILTWRDGQTAQLPLPDAWYLKRSLPIGGSAQCDGVGVHTVASGELILIFVTEGRPGWNHLSAVLIDPTSRKVLDTIADLGESPDDYQLKAQTKGLSVKLYKSWRHSKDGGEAGVTQWKEITAINSRLQSTWNP
jgi:hypothetical protein